MATVEASRRVALLARPGAARECVRGALLDVGAQVVVEEDPSTGDPEQLRGASPDVVLVVLDAASEDALERYDLLLGDPSIEVMIEEADIAVAREGWEAARWRRHLAAKLNHRADVLPPVAGGAEVPAVDGLSAHIEELIAVDEAGEPAGVTADLPEPATGGQDFSIFDPVAAESGGEADGFVLAIDGLELDTASVDPLPPVTGPDFAASDFDPLLAELDAGFDAPALPDTGHDWQSQDTVPGTRERDWDGGLIESFGADPVRAEAIAEEASRTGFGELSLADDPAPVAAVAASQSRFNRDLGDLERRISSLQLVDDAAGDQAPQPPAAASAHPVAGGGAVLVLGGLGGPDAVRQLLAGLPAGFPRPVLVRQKLDGARYDKLVTQMGRAAAMPVELAQAGDVAQPGTVYILPDNVTVAADGGLRFGQGDASRAIEALPASDSAVVMLSGSDVDDVERAAMLGARGALLAAQGADNCYDAAAPEALARQGAGTASPVELARMLVRRWSA